MAELVLRRFGDTGRGIVAEDLVLTHDEAARAAAVRAAYLASRRQSGPFHVAVLLDNTPEFCLWLEGIALAGAVMVGANPTHRGDELARDLTHTECQLMVTSRHLHPLVEGLFPPERTLVVDDEDSSAALTEFAGAEPPDPAAVGVKPDSLGYLLFTSGTSGAPKACRCTQGRMAGIGHALATMYELGPEDACYLSMPLFHSNALMAGWAPSLAAGATAALPTGGRFSASGFLPDVRRHGVTYFNYVGKPLAYIMATPEQPDDADNPLRNAFGNEGNQDDVERFGVRFGCSVRDAYGSTEGGAVISRTPDSPPGSLGRAPEGTVVLDSATGLECPPARFDGQGRLTNAEEAIGELVSKTGGAGFEGYWHNEEAEQARLREGWYWTGDLAYRDEEGFFYFAGRDHDWIRVDGENFASAPVERILQRDPDVVLAAVYAVPDTVVGDQVMAALQRRPGAAPFDPEDFAKFLGAQADLGTKWAPRMVRLSESLPVTATNKVLKRALRAERWRCTDPVWWQPERNGPYRLLTADDVATLDAATADRPI
jgi:fatty-acyl-CoA synthase